MVAAVQASLAEREEAHRPRPRIPLTVAVAEEFARQHAWNVIVDVWPCRDHYTVTAINVKYESIHLFEEAGFTRTERMRFVGGPKRSGPRIHMRKFIPANLGR